MDTSLDAGERPAGPAITIAIDAAASTCASLELNGVPALRAVLVTSADRLVGHTVEVAIHGTDIEPWRAPVESLPFGGTVEIDASGFTVPVAILRR
jgi:hypothetical protein